LKANKVGGRPGLGIFTKNWEALSDLESIKFNETIRSTGRMTHQIPNLDHGCHPLRCMAFSWVEVLGDEFFHIVLWNNK
jgi:hypothetical protein